MIRPHYMPPSLLSEGLYCSRRLWLKANNVECFEDKLTLGHAKTLKAHIKEVGIDDTGWRYEARLPSGTRLDAWIPEEALGIEFKSGQPHVTHLYQVWAMHHELTQLGVKELEMQVWYHGEHAEKAAKLAEYWALEHGELHKNIYAICADTGDPDFFIKLDRNAAILKGEVETEVMPESKDVSSKACRSCSFIEWCHS